MCVARSAAEMGGDLATFRSPCSSDVKCCACNDDEERLGIDINFPVPDEQVTLDVPAKPSEPSKVGQLTQVPDDNLGPLVSSFQSAALDRAAKELIWQEEVSNVGSNADGLAFVEVDSSTFTSPEQPRHDNEVPAWPPEVTGSPGAGRACRASPDELAVDARASPAVEVAPEDLVAFRLEADRLASCGLQLEADHPNLVSLGAAERSTHNAAGVLKPGWNDDARIAASKMV